MSDDWEGMIADESKAKEIQQQILDNSMFASNPRYNATLIILASMTSNPKYYDHTE